jgi:hypothetical protein
MNEINAERISDSDVGTRKRFGRFLTVGAPVMIKERLLDPVEIPRITRRWAERIVKS